MLLILIPIVWLAVAVLFVCICAMAARGDAQPAPLIDTSPAELSPVELDRLESRDAQALSARDQRLRDSWQPAAHGLG